MHWGQLLEETGLSERLNITHTGQTPQVEQEKVPVFVPYHPPPTLALPTPLHPHTCCMSHVAGRL